MLMVSPKGEAFSWFMMQHDISGGPPDVANKQLIGAGKDNCKQNKHISK